MTETLTKASLSDALSEVTGFPKTESQKFVETFFNKIADALVNGEDVKLSGFGRFSLRDKVSRPGRNPITMESVEIVARRVVTWNQGNKLSKRIDGFSRTESDKVES